ncbi:MAG: acetyl-CoA hydrolase/transferase family protein [Candidatus Lambdaproteobacteria bacterium]|nr:acetyl-CoA hydrolase/transferase family protein [Candidatus Lambdaproteobacteria bacterium]
MPKTIQAADVPALLRPGMVVQAQGAASEPLEIMAAIQAAPQASDGVHYLQMYIPSVNKGDYSAFHPNARATSFFITPGCRASFQAGKIGYHPFHLSTNYRYLSALPPIDLLILSLSPPDAHGMCSLACSAAYVWATLPKARVVVAEINRQAPRTFGAPPVPLSRLDYIVECGYTPIEVPSQPLNDASRAIGRHVAGLVRDGDCIQIGIGNVPNAILAELGHRNDLGFHSGMMTDACIDLIASGTMNGSRKAIDRHVHVTGIVVGTKRLFDFVHENTRVHFREVGYTHEQETLRHLDNFVSLNSVLEVDLLGQGNAEMIDAEQQGGVGGQADFVRGARNSRGGRSVLAFLSTGRRGTLSRVVSRLPQGTVVSTPRADVDYVVTEHGVAHLRDLNIDDRAAALIGVADPRFRDELHAAWKDMRKSM